MASAGRILIIPKGNYNAETTYEPLDLVFHGDTSRLAKKNAVGIEPSDANSEHWFKMCKATDLTSIYNRLQAIESQLLSSISLDDIDLSGYAKTEDLTELGSRVGTAEIKITSLEETLNGMGDSSANFSNRNVLDYDNKVTRDHASLPYTCPSAGEVTVHIQISNSGGNLKIDKNGLPAAYLVGNTTGAPYVASTFPVAKGDIINRNGIAGNLESGKITFVPYKYQ
jgi:hypothetical protein